MKEDDPINELDLIERYLAETLSPPEKEGVEVKIQTNPEFAVKVKELQQIRQLLRAASVQRRARAELQDIYLESKSRRWNSSPLYKWGLSAAAALAGFLLYFCLAPVHLPSIADDLLTVRSEMPTADLQAGQTTTYDQLLAGQNAIANRNYLLAISYLEKIQQQKDLRSYFREATQWYLVLAYLNSDQPKMAEKYYAVVTDLDNPEYPVDWLERIKIYVQIQRRKFL